MPGKRQPDPYMMTRGGVKVPLYNTPPECFDPVQIARTLAHLPRYVGNYGAYSVAQHAVNVAKVVFKLKPVKSPLTTLNPREFDRRIKQNPDNRALGLAALHHDDAEAITGDIPSPVKRELKDSFQPIEDSLNRAIEDRYELGQGALDDPIIKEADLIVFCAEVRMLIPKESWGPYAQDVGVDINYKAGLQPRWKDITPWTANQAFATYMDYHEKVVQWERS